jgi:hypothetical protein
VLRQLSAEFPRGEIAAREHGKPPLGHRLGYAAMGKDVSVVRSRKLLLRSTKEISALFKANTRI